jgi:hypothetical protein
VEQWQLYKRGRNLLPVLVPVVLAALLVLFVLVVLVVLIVLVVAGLLVSSHGGLQKVKLR